MGRIISLIITKMTLKKKINECCSPNVLSDMRKFSNLPNIGVEYQSIYIKILPHFYVWHWKKVLKHIYGIRLCYCHNQGQSKVELYNLEWYYYPEVPPPPYNRGGYNDNNVKNNCVSLAQLSPACLKLFIIHVSH